MDSVASLALAAIERGYELLNHVDYRLADTPAEREQIYRLRYRAYLQEGAIEPRADERVTDRFDDMPNTWIFGVYYDGALASSIRVSVATPEMPISPSVDAFSDVLHPELAKGKIIVDPTRFVAEPTRARTYRELPYLTVRLGYVGCEHFGADIGLASVRADHAAFYRRVFGAVEMSDVRPYPGLNFPVVLYNSNSSINLQQIYARFVRGHTRDPRFARLGGLVTVLGRQADAVISSGSL